MKVLVTGGAGYIGSHTARMLLEVGHQVVIFDNLSAGHRAALPSAAAFVQGDLLNPADIAALLAAHHTPASPIDGVMHFASRILVGESMQNPFLYLRENVQTVTNLLEGVTQAGIKRFILSSTANLFDQPQRIPIDESEALIPGSIYGETKYIAERYLAWMDRIYGLKYCCLRYFNASGAHPDGSIGEDHHPETHLIPIVLQVALGQRPHLSVFGNDYDTPDGTNIRDYIHVLDLARAHIMALEALADGRSRVYNLGTGRGYSVLEVVETARQVTGHAIPLQMAPRRAGDVDTLVADSAKISAELGWEPQYGDLKSIIETAWRWHVGHPKGYGDR
jgi:UDP-glucose 4-epimerase